MHVVNHTFRRLACDLMHVAKAKLASGFVKTIFYSVSRKFGELANVYLRAISWTKMQQSLGGPLGMS